jgi:hypothetical protein
VRVLVATLLVADLVVSGALAAPDTSTLSFTLRLDSGAAPLIAGKRIGTLPQASRVFGRPTTLSSVSEPEPVCRAFWLRLGLTIVFSNADVASCSASTGLWTRVTATDPRWQTTAGLHVGDTERRLHALYPQAPRLDFLRLGPIWELETGGPLCDGGHPLSLGGRVRAARVSALTILHVPACG